MIEEQKIYVIVAGTVQTPSRRTVIQPPGRQIAQACHVVSKLRHSMIKYDFDHKYHTWDVTTFEPVTTIILQARDTSELWHVRNLLFKRKLGPLMFADTNLEAYGPGDIVTAVAVLATKKQIEGVLDYLPLWGANV
jgi:hypothetical protein